MSVAFLQSFLDWLVQHSLWAGFIIFVIAFSESLALVGLLVPGAFFMFAIGTLISTGHLSFVSTCLWAISGAILGDAVSYWLGNYYRDNLKKLWPLSRHPQLLERGSAFFLRHGGKSVLLGRFVGPLRPVIPAIAGMNNMPLNRFLVANILSGIAWGPVYLLPGMAFGLSLTVASEVAGRLVVMVLLLIVLTLLLLWVGQRLYHLCLPHIDKVFFRLANWSHRHPLAGHIPAALIRPDHPEVRILSLLALLLLLATAMLIGVTHWIETESLMQQLDNVIRYNSQRLYTPGFSKLMAWFVGWAALPVVLGTVFISSLWLLVQQNRLALWHLLAALCFPWGMLELLQLIFPPTNAGTLFPAADVTLATAVYGFMAVVLAREVTQRYHLLVYLPAGIVVFLISFAGLYLQLHKFSDVLAGLAVGAIWLSLIGIAYRRHVSQAYIRTQPIVLLTLLLSATVFFLSPLLSRPLPEQPEAEIQTVAAATWQTHGWQALPRYRRDLRDLKQHPLTLQWAASMAMIRARLFAAGWKVPPGVQGFGILQWLNPEPDLKNLPVLPQLHDGRYDAVHLVKYTKDGVYVLRLWQSGYRVEFEDHIVPLWFGNVGLLQRSRLLGLTIFRTGTDFSTPLAGLPGDLTAVQIIDKTNTDRALLLLHEKIIR
ncbi:MAG: VTT domain-containing protein [Gammaproteobacteria bacterium]|nr:VTT domain-containing protein [Gammaproteobacteria bacterium]